MCGRDHMAFRSAYFPVKDVVDGDLCAQYPTVRASEGCDMMRCDGKKERCLFHCPGAIPPGWGCYPVYSSFKLQCTWKPLPSHFMLYVQLTAAKQRSIAEELERTPGEVLKKLEDIRNKIL